MKHIFTFSLCICVAALAIAQAPTGNRGFRLPATGQRATVYQLKDSVSYYPQPRTLEDNVFFKVEADAKLTIGGEDYGLIFIPGDTASLGGHTPPCSLYRNTPYNRLSTCDYRRRWWVKSTDLDKALPSYETGWRSRSLAVGAITLPIIVRPRRGDVPFTLDADANLGGCLAGRIGLSDTKKRYVSVLGFASLKSIKHTKSNNTGAAVDSTDVDGSGLALGGGLAVEWDGVQLGGFLGCDMASGELSKTYVYQNALWIGFGIGVNIFAPTRTDAEPKNP